MSFSFVPGFTWGQTPPRNLTLGGTHITLEVARTPSEQNTGLMHRTRLAPQSGMLFVFDRPRPIAMWMKNTLIDLDVAFIDPCGVVLNIETMKAQTLDLHYSRGEVIHAIEMNAGWFIKHGVRSGTRIRALHNPKHCPNPDL